MFYLKLNHLGVFIPLVLDRVRGGVNVSFLPVKPCTAPSKILPVKVFFFFLGVKVYISSSSSSNTCLGTGILDVVERGVDDLEEVVVGGLDGSCRLGTVRGVLDVVGVPNVVRVERDVGGGLLAEEAGVRGV